MSGDTATGSEPTCGRHAVGDGSGWEFDGRGLALARVCQRCRDDRFANFRSEILGRYTEADVDEPIESDDAAA